MLKNKLKFSYLLKAILLRMFDGSTTSTVDRTCHIPITFSTGELHVVDLFVTKLDEEYSVVLGYDWLTQHNPSIDWLEMSPSSVQRMPNPFQTSPDWLEAKATLTAQPEDPLSGVPQEYHEFHNVFSGERPMC